MVLWCPVDSVAKTLFAEPVLLKAEVRLLALLHIPTPLCPWSGQAPANFLLTAALSAVLDVTVQFKQVLHVCEFFPQRMFVSGNFTWGTKKPCTPGGGRKARPDLLCPWDRQIPWNASGGQDARSLISFICPSSSEGAVSKLALKADTWNVLSKKSLVFGF